MSVNEGWLSGFMEVVTMPAMIDFPQVIKDAAPQFADFFRYDPQHKHLEEYLTGLMVTVST